jgi:hypothetical protein
VDRLFSLASRQWFAEHDKDLRGTWRNQKADFLASYEVPDDAVASFWDFVQDEGILTLTTNPDEVDPKNQVFLKADAEDARRIVRLHLKGYIANTLFGRGAGQPVLNQVDPTVQRALSLWPASTDLAGYHAAASSKN